MFWNSLIFPWFSAKFQIPWFFPAGNFFSPFPLFSRVRGHPEYYTLIRLGILFTTLHLVNETLDFILIKFHFELIYYAKILTVKRSVVKKKMLKRKEKQELWQDSVAPPNYPFSSYDMAYWTEPFIQLTLGYGVYNQRLCYYMIMFQIWKGSVQWLPRYKCLKNLFVKLY